MLGEVGLDGGARVRWPLGARHLYTEKYGLEAGSEDKVDDQGEWKRLTPFKTNMAHQRDIVERQLEVAIEEGVNVSFHSVAAAGESYQRIRLSLNCMESGSAELNRTDVGGAVQDAGQVRPKVYQRDQRRYTFRRRLVSRVLARCRGLFTEG